jgi:hypothetical protein
MVFRRLVSIGWTWAELRRWPSYNWFVVGGGTLLQRSDQCLIGEAMLPSSEAEAAEALWQGTGAGGGDADVIGEC